VPVQVDAEQTMTMLGRLTGLRRLNLLSVEELGNEHLQRISEKLIHLQHLKARPHHLLLRICNLPEGEGGAFHPSWSQEQNFYYMAWQRSGNQDF
jgi:hypothetical protein